MKKLVLFVFVLASVAKADMNLWRYEGGGGYLVNMMKQNLPWVETVNGVPTYYFNEVRRDGTTVYLHDPSRDMNVELSWYQMTWYQGANGQHFTRQGGYDRRRYLTAQLREGGTLILRFTPGNQWSATVYLPNFNSPISQETFTEIKRVNDLIVLYNSTSHLRMFIHDNGSVSMKDDDDGIQHDLADRGRWSDNY